MPGQTLTSVEMLERLIGYDTTSRNSNLALMEFVADYLDGHGIQALLIRDPTGTKANLHARIGPDRDGGIVLSGHTDVVPVDGQPWTSDPFRLVRRDDRLLGRGTADMKTFCAVALALVPEALRQPLAAPLHFAFSYDEEVGCLGVPDLIRHLAGQPRPAAVIVGEPTEMRLVDAHKSCTAGKVVVRGLEQHSSNTPGGVNAVMYAAEMISFLSRLSEELGQRREPGCERFEPPCSTVHVGIVAGGTAGNIVPRHCEFTWEHRALPQSDETEVLRRLTDLAQSTLLPRMRRVFADADIDIRVAAHVPALRPEPGSAAETLVKALNGSNSTQAVSYASEAGMFQNIGIPTVVCGPGNIREAHRPDEYVEIAQVEACTDFLRRLIGRLAA